MNNENNIKLNSESIKIEIKPTIDIVFKRLFGYDKNKDILADFLNDVLKYYGNFNFDKENLIFNNTELMVDDINEKFSRIEILVSKFKNTKIKELRSRDINESNKEEIINIEIQVSNNGNMYNRSEFYASRLISHSILKGQQYEKIPEVILINILDYNMFNDRIGYRYFPRKEIDFYKGKFYNNINGKLYDEQMEILKDEKNEVIDTDIKKCNNNLSTIHFIELRKFYENNNSNFGELSPWIKFLKDPNDKMFRSNDSSKLFKKAREELIVLQNDEEFKRKYEQRLNAYITKNSIFMSGKEEGRKESASIIENLEYKNKQIIIDTTFSYFNLKINLDKIKELSKLSENEVIKINEFINDPKRNVLDLAEKLNIKNEDLYDICDKYKILGEKEKNKKIKL